MRKGWEMKKLGDACDFQNGFAFKGNSFQEKGMPVLRISNIQNNEVDFDNLVYIDPNDYKEDLSKYEVKKNDLFIAMSGATTGKIGLNNSDTIFYLNQRVGKFKPKKNLSKNFLYYFLSTMAEESLRISAGSAQPNLSTEQIKSFQIPFPPFAEQEQIVSILDEAFATIDQAKENVQRNLQNAKDIYNSYLQDIFINKKLDWTEKILGEVCSLYQGIAINAKTKHALVEKSELPLLRIKDLKNNTVEQYIDPNNYPPNALVNETDLIYTRTGSLGLVFTGRKGVLHNNSFKIVPTKELEKSFLFIWLQNPLFKSKILSLAFKAAQPDITHVIFKQQKIFFPSLKEQKKIVSQLDTLSSETKALEKFYQQKLDNLEELKKSMLKKAFSGGLSSPEGALSANDRRSPSHKKKNRSSIKSPERA